MAELTKALCKVFLSTPSARRATYRCRFCSALPSYFYPRPPRGGRRASAPGESGPCYFYPRPPRGGRLAQKLSNLANKSFLSTPSARRATHRNRAGRRGVGISIHALREEGDGPGHDGRRVVDISIHALREEGDTPTSRQTPRRSYFYPRPPRGGRPVVDGDRPRDVSISIHALREEGDSS